MSIIKRPVLKIEYTLVCKYVPSHPTSHPHEQAVICATDDQDMRRQARLKGWSTKTVRLLARTAWASTGNLPPE